MCKKPMSQPCAIQDCKRASRTLCHCCNQNLCRDHFNEHDDLLNSQLNPLTDEINSLANRLTAINIDRITNDSRQKLNEWRIDCHIKIDEYYEEKCKELDRYVNKSVNEQRKAIADLRSKMSELIEKQETTKDDINSLTSAIKALERQMNEIEHFRVEIDIHPLVIDSHLIQIGRSEVYQFDLRELPAPHQTMNRIRVHEYEMASSDRFLLVYIDRNLCLIDKDLLIAKQSKWENCIGDMCWSSELGCFFMINQNRVVSIDENRLSPEQILETKGENLLSCGCSKQSLYLSQDAWNSSVFEYTLLPSIQFLKVWKTTDKLNSEQRVDSIKCNSETLALVINDRSNQTKFMQLRSLKNFSPIWSVRFDIEYNRKMMRCCSLNGCGWLVSDWYTSCLFHITNEGKVKGKNKYTSIPYNINLFGSNILVIMTDGGINFLKL